MTAKRILVSPAEVEKHLALLKRHGLPIGAVDIRVDGVTIWPPSESPPQAGDRTGESAFDQWLQKDADRERTASRQ